MKKTSEILSRAQGSIRKSKNFNGKEKNQAILKNDLDFNKEKAATEGYLEKYLTFFLVDFPFNMEDGRLG